MNTAMPLVKVEIIISVTEDPEQTDDNKMAMGTEMELGIFPADDDIPKEIVFAGALGGVRAALQTLQEEWDRHNDANVEITELEEVRKLTTEEMEERRRGRSE